MPTKNKSKFNLCSAGLCSYITQRLKLEIWMHQKNSGLPLAMELMSATTVKYSELDQEPVTLPTLSANVFIVTINHLIGVDGITRTPLWGIKGFRDVCPVFKFIFVRQLLPLWAKDTECFSEKYCKIAKCCFYFDSAKEAALRVYLLPPEIVTCRLQTLPAPLSGLQGVWAAVPRGCTYCKWHFQVGLLSTLLIGIN